jgi:hypothetical protein
VHSPVNSFEYNVSGTSSVPILRQNWFNIQLDCPVFFYLPRQGESDRFCSAQTVKLVGGLLTVGLLRLAARSLSDVLQAARLCWVRTRHPCWCFPDVILFQWLLLLCGPCILLSWRRGCAPEKTILNHVAAKALKLISLFNVSRTVIGHKTHTHTHTHIYTGTGNAEMQLCIWGSNTPLKNRHSCFESSLLWHSTAAEFSTVVILCCYTELLILHNTENYSTNPTVRSPTDVQYIVSRNCKYGGNPSSISWLCSSDEMLTDVMYRQTQQFFFLLRLKSLTLGTHAPM